MCTVTDKQLRIEAIGNVEMDINQYGKKDTILVTNVSTLSTNYFLWVK